MLSSPAAFVPRQPSPVVFRVKARIPLTCAASRYSVLRHSLMERHHVSNAPEAEKYLPLTPPVFHVLVALADGDKHGYAILKEVADRTGGKVQLSSGTLYAIIKRLLQDGLIDEIAERPDHDDERRRYYGLTAFGRQVAAAEAERMEELLSAARAKRLIRKTRHA
jgi:DNA-binding PadR family transcriptional regulator